MSAHKSRLDQYISLFPIEERHQRERDIRSVIMGDDDPFLITAIHSAESRKATMDALAHRLGPRLTRRTFVVLSIVLGFATGVISAVVTSKLMTDQLQSKLTKLEQTTDAATLRLAQIDVFTKAEYDLMVQSRSILTAGVAMARIYNSSPLAALGRSGSDVVLILPKGQVSMEPSDEKNDRLVIRKDIIGNGIEQNFFEQQLQKATEKESAPPPNP